MKITGIQNVKKVSAVCSDHFENESYHQTDGYTKTRRLLSTAVPVLYRNNSLHTQITKNIVIPSAIEETCSDDKDNSLRNSFRNTNKPVSDFSINSNTSNHIDECDGSQDLGTGTGNTEVSFLQPKSTEMITNDKIGKNSKR